MMLGIVSSFVSTCKLCPNLIEPGQAVARTEAGDAWAHVRCIEDALYGAIFP